MPSSPTCSREKAANGERWPTNRSTAPKSSSAWSTADELARGLDKLGYGIEKTHADGRFEIAAVSRKVIEAYSTRRAEIEAAMNEARPRGKSADNPRLAERAALMTRSHKREVDHEALREHWKQQAAELGFDAVSIAAGAMERTAGRANAELPLDSRGTPGEERTASAAEKAVSWAVAHLSEREAVFSRTDVLAAALAWKPGAVSIGEAERTVSELQKSGVLHAANLPVQGESLTHRQGHRR